METIRPSESEKNRMQLILSYWQAAEDHGDQNSKDRVLSLLIDTISAMLRGQQPNVNELEIRQYLDASRLYYDMSLEIHKLEQDRATAQSAAIMKTALASYENTLKAVDARCGADLKPVASGTVRASIQQSQTETEEELPSHIAARKRLWEDDLD